jgi:hypothetical protein
MATLTKSNTEAVEAVLTAPDYPRLSLSLMSGRGEARKFCASTYWPNGDVSRDIGCYGYGPTIDVALTELSAQWEAAAAKGKKLRTAAECKAAVIELIREHDAAPASFRDAVDALPVGL